MLDLDDSPRAVTTKPRASSHLLITMDHSDMALPSHNSGIAAAFNDLRARSKIPSSA